MRPKFDGKALLKACSNGMSEMVGMLAITVTMIAMNVILMKLSGSDGVAAAAIILSVQTILSASYVGYIERHCPNNQFSLWCRKYFGTLDAFSCSTKNDCRNVSGDICNLLSAGKTECIALC